MKYVRLGNIIVGIILWVSTYSYLYALSPTTPQVMYNIARVNSKALELMAPIDTGTLLFSDSPEYVVQDGILYADKVQGDIRFYFYHVNDNFYDRKIVVMAYNPSPQIVLAQVRNSQYAKPSRSYYKVGKELSMLYYRTRQYTKTVLIMPQDYAILDERLDQVVVHPQELFSGIVDLYTPKLLFISAMMMPITEDAITFVKKQQYLPSDRAKLRGTFQGKERYLQGTTPYSTQMGICHIKLVDNKNDRFLQGWDSMDSRLADNRGNYGVAYTIHVKTKGKGDIHLYFNPQGGAYAGVAKLIYNKGQRNEMIKDISLPEKGLHIGHKDMYAIQYMDTFSAGKDVQILFMPPGAANLPVRFILVPEKNIAQVISDEADSNHPHTAVEREEADNKRNHYNMLISKKDLEQLLRPLQED